MASDVVWIPHPTNRNTCPYCNIAIHWESIGTAVVSVAVLKVGVCPACSEFAVDVMRQGDATRSWRAAWPHARRIAIPLEVDQEVARDWHEAVAVAPKSIRAAAILARRALQLTLRKKGFGSRSLKAEIDLATASADTPTTLRDKLHVVRDIGNDAAHPNEDPEGALADVTAADLEFLFETLLEAFDVYFVRPERHRKLLEARNKAGSGS